MHISLDDEDYLKIDQDLLKNFLIRNGFVQYSSFQFGEQWKNETRFEFFLIPYATASDYLDVMRSQIKRLAINAEMSEGDLYNSIMNIEYIIVKKE